MKKPQKTDVEMMFSRIKQSPLLINDPIKTEKFKSVSDERISKITYHDNSNPIEFSADEAMKCAIECPSFLIQRTPWHLIMPWLDTPVAELKKFWSFYRLETSQKGRELAVHGVKSDNRKNERVLLNAVHEYKALSIKNWGFDLGKDEQPSLLVAAAASESERYAMMETLKQKMADWVLDAIWNDPEAPKRLHELLKGKKTAKSEDQDHSTINSRIFTSFVQEITGCWKLPTKKTVRTKANLGDKNEDYAAASRAFDLLGLAGLPEG